LQSRVFLFTDIEASTRRWEHDPASMSAALARHDEVARRVIGEHRGELLKHTGDGVLAVFGEAADALRAAVAMQRALPDEVPVRAGMHVGPAEERDGDYFGPTLNRAARIMAVARGGQVVVSAEVARLVGDDVPPACSLVDVGEHLLKDFERPQRLFQAVGERLSHEPVSAPSRVAALGSRSSFVGRETDVAELESLLATERLLTLTGVGGTGKTRLAYEVADRIGPRIADGVFVVELGSLADPDELARAVAGAVDMPIVAAGVERDLTIFLRTRRCLVVLDNCEHMLDACAALVDRVLAECPGVTFLATSREALAVAGERAWRVPSLSLPDEATDPLACDAAALFIARASTVRTDFASEEHVDAIAEICRRLDGLPLALELAAARVSHLTPEQIASMLDDRFRLLTGGTRRARQRQQTLQAAMDWSHDLLSDDERRLLRRLSVFGGRLHAGGRDRSVRRRRRSARGGRQSRLPRRPVVGRRRRRRRHRDAVPHARDGAAVRAGAAGRGGGSRGTARPAPRLDARVPRRRP
jgi:hypothetical protein